MILSREVTLTFEPMAETRDVDVGAGSRWTAAKVEGVEAAHGLALQDVEGRHDGHCFQ